jgi:hypothetical protein
MSVPEDLAKARAHPLPEEQVVTHAGEDREAAAAEILRDSERRVAEAAEADAPGDARDQHRN